MTTVMSPSFNKCLQKSCLVLEIFCQKDRAECRRWEEGGRRWEAPFQVREGDNGNETWFPKGMTCAIFVCTGWGDWSGGMCLRMKVCRYEMRTRGNIFSWQGGGKFREKQRQSKKGRAGRTGEVGREIRSESTQPLSQPEGAHYYSRRWVGREEPHVPGCILAQDLCY